MGIPLKRLKIPYLAIGFVAVWMYGAGSAWAGDGGESLTGLNNIVSGLCTLLSIPTCPQLPTITQAVLEIAGLETSPPEIIRALNSVAPGTYVDAGNAAALPPTPFPLNSTTSPTLSNLLSTLTPLAFDSGWKSGPAEATQLYDPNADTFLYAVASGPPPVASTGLTVPNALNLFYDDTSWMTSYVSPGQKIAKFSLQLTVLNSDGMTERPVPATLQYISPSRGELPCSASTLTGNFSGNGSGTQTLLASQLGVNCALVFGPSPTSKKPHAIFEIQVPLLVTIATDPPYFFFSLNAPMLGPINASIPSAFFTDETGFTPASGILGSTGMEIGVAPSAAPLGPPPATGVSSVFALCASLPRNGYGPRLVPSVAADYVIAVDGETIISAPLPAVSTSVCSF